VLDVRLFLERGEGARGCASIIKTIFGTKLSSQISFVLQLINQSINLQKECDDLMKSIVVVVLVVVMCE